MFVLFLPSNSCVCLMNKRDGQIQTVVWEFVLRIGATTNEEKFGQIKLGYKNKSNKHPLERRIFF